MIRRRSSPRSPGRGPWSARRRAPPRDRARATRASATRLRMPPERSDGIFCSMPASRTASSFSATARRDRLLVERRCARAAGRRCSRRPSSSRTARRTGTASRPARAAGRALSPARPAISWPSKRMRPESGDSRPISERSVTDLPVPERPRITKHSPRADVEVEASRTLRAAVALAQALGLGSRLRSGRWPIAGHLQPITKDKEQLGQEEVGDQHGDRPQHHGVAWWRGRRRRRRPGR